MKAWNNGKLRELSAEEIAVIEADRKAWNDAKTTRQLASIRKIRNQKLFETDYFANSDVTMPDYIKTWRQTLRDLPQNNTTESQYDTLLARDADGNLTNSVWTQPTE
jgi:hypothetical protein